MAIPNCQHIVAQLRDQYPAEWRKAHNPSGGGPETEAFIRRVAWVLHSTVDARFGLNGKRGNYNDVSDDVVNFIGEGPGHDPNTGQPVTVIDVIARAGGNHDDPDERNRPSAYWGVIESPGPGGWIKPVAVGGASSGGGGTPSPAPPSPAPATDLTPILAALAALSAKVDAVGAIALEARDSATAARAEAASAAHDGRELNAARRDGTLVPAVNVGVVTFPQYTCRIFGQSLTLTPKG